MVSVIVSTRATSALLRMRVTGTIIVGARRTNPEETMNDASTSSRRQFVLGSAALAAAAGLPRAARAADPVRIGLVLPLTGPFASTGRQIEAAVRLYMARNGDTVAGQ